MGKKSKKGQQREAQHAHHKAGDGNHEHHRLHGGPLHDKYHRHQHSNSATKNVNKNVKAADSLLDDLAAIEAAVSVSVPGSDDHDHELDENEKNDRDHDRDSSSGISDVSSSHDSDSSSSDSSSDSDSDNSQDSNSSRSSSSSSASSRSDDSSSSSSDEQDRPPHRPQQDKGLHRGSNSKLNSNSNRTAAVLSTLAAMKEQDDYWFLYHPENDHPVPTHIRKVKVHKDSLEIRDQAFGACAALFEIQIPALRCRRIGNQAFVGCLNLQHISIAKHIQLVEIGYHAFEDCSAVQAMVIPNSVVTLGPGAFMGCTRLEQVQLPLPQPEQAANTTGAVVLTQLPDDVFRLCESLQRLELPNTLTYIGQAAFAQCTSLIELHIPNSVTDLGTSCLRHCRSLQVLELPRHLTELREHVLDGCESLLELDLPRGIRRLGDFCFSSCKNLRLLQIPSACTSLGSHCFSKCASLQIVTLYTPLGDTPRRRCRHTGHLDIPDDCFSHCDELVLIHFRPEPEPVMETRTKKKKKHKKKKTKKEPEPDII